MMRWTLSCVLLAAPAHAQLAAGLKIAKTQHLAGEPVLATLTVTNHAGRDLVLQGDNHRSWLSLNVKNHRGELVSQRPDTSFGALEIPAGTTMAREVDLAQHFSLQEVGNYTVSAVVRMPGTADGGVGTQRALFNVQNGRTYWSQKVGVPGKPNELREHRVVFFRGDQRTAIFAQLADGKSGWLLRTVPLGEAISIRKPMVVVDGAQTLHVLYLGTPTMWVHCRIDIDGNLLGRDIHQRADEGDPRLIQMGDGSVFVSNSIPYDPRAAEEARSKIRKLSDRP